MQTGFVLCLQVLLSDSASLYAQKSMHTTHSNNVQNKRRKYKWHKMAYAANEADVW